MNVYDTQKITTILCGHGYEMSETITSADIVILYTCNIREKAIQKVYSDLGKLKNLKKSNKDMIIAVGGCMAQQLGKEILKHSSIVDIIFGPQNIHEINTLIEDKKRPTILNTFDAPAKFSAISKLNPEYIPSAFLTIQEGCDNFCTYCVVPYTRGREYSRNVDEIITEAEKLSELGVREITLLGQNVNAYKSSYHGMSYRLEDLIYELSKISGIQRIRYTSSNPQNMTDGLIMAHKNIDKLMPQIHLPVQSGSNRILKQMNRPYSAEEYIEIIEKIRSIQKNIAISSDFIVGFPSETEEEFLQTIDLIKKVGYATAFYFKYSKRPGTPAASMPEQISEEEKQNRFMAIDQILKQQQLDFNTSFLHQKVKVLIEAETDATLYGKTEHNISCLIDKISSPRINVGDIVDINIQTTNLKTISGEVKI